VLLVVRGGAPTPEVGRVGNSPTVAVPEREVRDRRGRGAGKRWTSAGTRGSPGNPGTNSEITRPAE